MKAQKKTSCFQVQGFRSVSRFKSYFGDKLTPKFFEENIKVIQTAYQIIGVTDAIPSKKNCPEFNNIFFIDLKCYIFCIQQCYCPFGCPRQMVICWYLAHAQGHMYILYSTQCIYYIYPTRMYYMYTQYNPVVNQPVGPQLASCLIKYTGYW